MKRNLKFILAVATVCGIGVGCYFAFWPNKAEKKPAKSAEMVAQNQVEAPKIDDTLTLQKIFSGKGAANFNPDDLVTIIMTGDIAPVRYVNYKLTKTGDFLAPYRATTDYLKAADLTVGNLETTLIKNCQPTLTGMSFCGSSKSISGLTSAGFDVLSLANNHTLNKGRSALTETISNLSATGISGVVEGDIVYKTVKGTKFALLAYNGVEDTFDLAAIKKDIADAKKNADVVVVMPHWGKEYVRTPQAGGQIAPQDPKVMSHVMIDAGADIILGNHPHWYQGAEIYKNKLVMYAHGNFVFDQDWSEETMKGFVGKYTFYKGKLVQTEFKPIKIRYNYQPYFLEGAAADAILNDIKKNSWED